MSFAQMRQTSAKTCCLLQWTYLNNCYPFPPVSLIKISLDFVLTMAIVLA